MKIKTELDKTKNPLNFKGFSIIGKENYPSSSSVAFADKSPGSSSSSSVEFNSKKLKKEPP